MDQTYTIFRLAVHTVLLLQQPQPQPARPAEPVTINVSPNEHVRRATLFLLSDVPEKDRYYTRFVSFYHLPTPDDVTFYRRVLSWWVHQMTFEGAISLPNEVPGTNGSLLWIDLRWYGWSAAAWREVASRDPYFRQPGILAGDGITLTELVGEKPSDIDAKGTSHIIAVVNGEWFLRETIETRRSSSYYDLLFSRQRFKEEKVPTKVTKVWKGGKDAEGTYYPPGYTYERTEYVTRTTRIDFPANEKDWEQAFGIDVTKQFASDQKIDLDIGAVAAGGRDDPRNGSMVALNNRIIQILFSPLGPAMKTFDVLETTGNKDYSETLIFDPDQKGFVRGKGVVVESDGGELLAYLPNGGQAGFLIDAQGNRVETAIADVANDVSDKRLNQGVRNPGSCVICHATSGGFIPPRDMIHKALEAGIKRKFPNDLEQEKRFQQFFFNWEGSLEGAQARYRRLIAQTTEPYWLPDDHPARRNTDPANGPWNGTDIADAVLKVRNSYDDPVDIDRASRYLGVPKDLFGYLASRSPKQRPLELLQGLSIPSRTWEVDVYPEITLLLDAYRNDADFLKRFGHVLSPPLHPVPSTPP